MKDKNIIGTVFFVVGIFVLVISLVWWYQIFRFVKNASTASGLVTNLNYGGSHPEISFTTDAGDSITYPQNGLIFGYKTNDQVPILYDTNNPKKASVNSFGALWGFTISFMVLGCAFVLIGYKKRIT